MLGHNSLRYLAAVLGQGVGIKSGFGQVEGEVQRIAQLLVGEGLQLRLGPGGDIRQPGGAGGQDGVHLLLPLVGHRLVLGVQQVLIVLGAGAGVDVLPVPVAPADHHLVTLQKIGVANVVAALGGWVVPGSIHMIPLAVHLHQVPGVIAPGVAGNGLIGNTGGVQHSFVGLGIAGADGGPLQQGSLGLMGDEGHIPGVHPVVVVAVGNQVVVEGLDHLVVAHAAGDQLIHHPLGLLLGLVGDVAPVMVRHRTDGDGAVGVVHRQGLGNLPVLFIGVQMGDTVGIFPVHIRDLQGQLLRLGCFQVESADVDGGLPVQKTGGNGQSGSGFVAQDRLLQLLVSQLLPQTIDHIGAGAVGLGGKGKPGGESAVPGPGHGGGGPVISLSLLPGKAAQEGEDLVIGQGAGQVEPVAPHAVGDPLLHRPEDSFIVEGVLVGDVAEAGGGGGGGRGPGSPPQEGHRLRPGYGPLRGKDAVSSALRNLLLHRPSHRVGVVGAVRHILKIGVRRGDRQGTCRQHQGQHSDQIHYLFHRSYLSFIVSDYIDGGGHARRPPPTLLCKSAAGSPIGFMTLLFF